MKSNNDHCKRWLLRTGGITILFSCLGIARVSALTLAWDANTETNIAGYIVHFGTATRSYTNHTTLSNITTNQVFGLVNGVTYYFAVTAYNTDGLESDFSNEVSFSVPTSNSPPTIFAPTVVLGSKGTQAAIAGVQITDSDAGSGAMTLVLSVPNGSLTLLTNVPGGIATSQVLSNSSASVQINAPLVALNTTFSAANGLVYFPRLNFVGTNVLALWINDNGNTGAGGAQSASAQTAINVRGTTLDFWRQRYFNGSDLADPAKETTLWGDLADPDQDGLSNLFEYALGLDPTTRDSSSLGLTSALSAANGQQYLTLAYRRRPADSSIQYIPEISQDTQNWFSSSNYVQEVSVQPYSSEFDWVTVANLTPISPQIAEFIRLRIVRTGP